MNLTGKQQQFLVREALQWFFAAATTSQKREMRKRLSLVIREEFQPLQANEGRQVIRRYRK
jgi:hypothetical protein